MKGGDLNAHSAAWGHDAEDVRGGNLLEWPIINEYMVGNEREQGATFQNTRGESYIDLTLTRGPAIDP